MNSPLTGLRPGASARPEVLVDGHSRRLSDQTTPLSVVGARGFLARGRLLFALPLYPVFVTQHRVLQAHDGCYVADPDGNLIGTEGVLIHRLLPAGKVEDTRRL